MYRVNATLRTQEIEIRTGEQYENPIDHSSPGKLRWWRSKANSPDTTYEVLNRGISYALTRVSVSVDASSG